ncbi:hypothetical protein [Corynebacterium alimapuense]|uniref:Uncharacterized protein n=1 Tax=Corynebacterium alimapuense TaxID=1576874 RepID=A0A3M8K924_9CORY|nr:hypothetical protein [Corynebacterium alimapuense]RNE49727.1 hypothetical protein C5L39_01870 [Corynebacterium alimapuense]
MTIRSQFQPTVDEFISTLNDFATGSYLKAEEKEFWDQPFNPKVLPELKSILEKMLDSFDALDDDPTEEDLVKVAQRWVDKLLEFNARHADAVIEPEEKEELGELIREAAAATGAEESALAELPELD